MIEKLRLFSPRRGLVAVGVIAAVVLGAYLLFALRLPRQPAAAELLIQQKDLIVGLPAKAGTLSLDKLVTIEDYEVMSKLHLGLVTVDSSGRIFPALASSWTVLKDGQEFIFHLRKDLTYPDGKPVQCTDALRTFEHMSRRPADPSLWAIQLVSATGCKSNTDFFVRLRQQSPFFLSEMSDIRYAIRRDPETDEGQLNGLGPYKVEKINKSTGELKLVRREKHPFLNANSPDVIRFTVVEDFEEAKRRLAAGRLHLYPLTGRRSEAPGQVVDSNRRDRVWMLVFSKIFFQRNPGLASCLGTKIDRRLILNEINDRSFLETSTLVPVSPAILLSSQDSRQFPNDDCRRYAGLKLRFLSMDHFDPKITGPILTELTRLGLRFRSKTEVQKEEILERLAAPDYDIALFAATVSSSPASDLANFYASNPTFPPSQWVDPLTSHVAALLGRSRNELEARDMITTLVGRTLRKGPLIPLFFETERYLAGRCIQVTDYESFRQNQQFAAISRQRDCP